MLDLSVRFVAYHLSIQSDQNPKNRFAIRIIGCADDWKIGISYMNRMKSFQFLNFSLFKLCCRSLDIDSSGNAQIHASTYPVIIKFFVSLYRNPCLTMISNYKNHRWLCTELLSNELQINKLKICGHFSNAPLSLPFLRRVLSSEEPDFSIKT